LDFARRSLGEARLIGGQRRRQIALRRLHVADSASGHRRLALKVGVVRLLRQQSLEDILRLFRRSNS
jgi:hypothetical protein